MRYRQRRAPLNQALVGKGNRLTMHSETLLVGGKGGRLIIGEHKNLRGVVRCNTRPVEGAKIPFSAIDSVYQSWRKKARAQWKEYRSRQEQGRLDSIRAWAERNPLTVTTTFNNEAGPDFSRIFEEAPVLEDTPATRQRLKDYAMHLRDLMAEQDTAGLTQEFLPVLWTGEDSLDMENLRSNFSGKQIQSVREHIVMKNAYLDIARSEVGLRSWSGGRVWELYYEPDGKALFGARTFRKGTPEYTGSGRKREVYVAELGGQLKVVR